MWLNHDLPDWMAPRGIALTPTLSGFLAIRDRPDDDRKKWIVGGKERHGSLVAAAAEAGVRVLAGTDSVPHGRVGDEIRALANTGMRPHDALGAGSWEARKYLGLQGLEPGAPADAVVYAEDPRQNLDALEHPEAVVLRGVRVR
jgi:imidazolonepropionase-like amidohydrolase